MPSGWKWRRKKKNPGSHVVVGFKDGEGLTVLPAFVLYDGQYRGRSRSYCQMWIRRNYNKDATKGFSQLRPRSIEWVEKRLPPPSPSRIGEDGDDVQA